MPRPLVLLLGLALVPAALAQGPAAQTDRDVVVQIYADLARGDHGAVAAVLDDHVLWVEGPYSPQIGRYMGPGTVVARVLRPQAGAPAFVPDTIAVEGDRVVAAGATRRPAPTTGRPITLRFRHVWRLADGRVTGVERTDDGPDLDASALCGGRC